ncbi:hypothetical protein [Albibacterium bauzanense]|uniref:O-antigen ligase-like membrane protein n=1 Tax=Albibacterium bauzanense TaxID=653929 RepID=A0A4R1LZV3_9SPHI|nr:hypothetical protein [Albibacterium bauzanense]TCK84875.1 hypothetical protein C8N28_0170 [Albibacterium bauzanense]
MLEETTFWERAKLSHVFLLLFFIFSVKFLFIPLNSSRFVILGCFVTLLIIRRNELIFYFNKNAFKAFSILVLYALYTAIITLFNGSGNMANLFVIILLLFQIAGGAYLLSAFFIKEDLNQLLYLLLLVFGIQGILIFINFIFPAYRELMFVIMPLEGNITEDSITSVFRTRGLMQSSGASVSAYLATGLLMGAYFLTSFKLSKIDRRIIIACLLCIVIGIVFTGRTGFIMIPVALLAYYTLLIINNKFSWKSLLLLIYIPIGSVLFYFLIKEMYILIQPEGEIIIRAWEKWAFDQFLDSFNGSSGKSNTLAALRSFIFLPEDDSHLLFGDPTSWGVVRTDVGYIRMIYAVGVIGAILFYAGIIRLYFFMMAHAKTLSIQVFYGFLLLWGVIIEYKEPMFSHFYFTSTIALMVFFNMREVKD